MYLIYGELKGFFYQEQCLPICLQLSSHNFILILRLDNISCLIPFSRAAAFPSEVELILKQVSLINPMISCKCTFSPYVFVKATLFSPRAQSFTLLNSDLCQDINEGFASSRYVCTLIENLLEGSALLRLW